MHRRLLVFYLGRLLPMPKLRMRQVQQQLVSVGHAGHVSLAVFVILQNMTCWDEDISQLQREWIEAACYLGRALTVSGLGGVSPLMLRLWRFAALHC